MKIILLLCLLGWQLAEAAPTQYQETRIIWDSYGIPTLAGQNWTQLVEAQGYVTAHERLWQMDIARRAAAGTLAAWFGSRALKHDQKRRSEDWLAVAQQAYADLTPQERQTAEAYAAGVNQFITAGHWGQEYRLLNLTPDPWRPEDSLLILLQLAEILTGTYEEEAANTRWQAALSPDWFALLFPASHPWNQPLFDAPAPAPRLPPPAEWLPAGPPALRPVTLREVFQLGSNNWAWRRGDQIYLANDPHLLRTVPNLWYALRLRLDARRWAAGVSVPGVPGIVLGRNAHLAWAFTNTGEDVDDLLQETLSPDQERYLAGHDERGLPRWQAIEKRPYTIEVADSEPVTGEAWFTQRGPLAQRPHLTGYYSRQWLGFHRGLLRIPAIGLNQATDWVSANAALDQVRLPAQNVLIAQTSGDLGYRVSGTGIQRQVSGLTAQPALLGAWRGLEPIAQRRRLQRKQDGQAAWLATANEQLWQAPFGHYWSSDDRALHLRTQLSGLQTASLDKMQQLQLDSTSPYYLALTRWLLAHAPTNPTPAQAELLHRWRTWDGRTESDPTALEAARQLHRILLRLLIGKVRTQLPDEFAQIPYFSRQQSALTLTVIQNPDGLAAFGLERAATVNWLLEQVILKKRDDFPYYNRWQAQHPLADLPFLGRAFKIAEMPQVGHGYALRVEGPQFGATVRLLYDLRHPEHDRLSLPVGQSGHVDDPHYQDLHARWFAGQYLPLLDPALHWEAVVAE